MPKPAPRYMKVLAGLLLFLAAAYYLSPPWMAKAGLLAERARAGLETKSLQVGNQRIAYLEGGTGPNIVMVHGFGGDKDNFTRMARFLTTRYHLIIPDLTGFGDSTKNMAVSYDVFAQASRLHDFVRSKGLTSFHLAGHSMGGGIVGAFGAKHPNLVQSLLLLAPAGVSAAPESEFFRMLNKGVNPFFVDNPSDFDQLMDLTVYRKPFIPRPVTLLYVAKLKEGREVLKKTVTDLKSVPFSLEDQVRQYPGPVFVIWGDQDRILHVKGGEILEALRPGVGFVSIQDCGHLPMLEFPKTTADHYLSFLEQQAS